MSKSKHFRAWLERVMSEGPWYPLAKDVVDFVEIHSSHFVLDVGSGFGDISAEAVRRGANVISLDFSLIYLEQTIRKAEGTAGVIADATYLPFRNSVFDRVVTKFVWHNIMDRIARERFIQELSRVVRSDGLVVVSAVWNKLYCLLNPKRMLTKPPFDDEFHHYFMPSEVKSILALANLRILEVQPSTMPFRNTLPLLDKILSPWWCAFSLDIKASRQQGLE